MTDVTPVSSQSYQPMPRLDTPLVDPTTGYVSRPWYRLLNTFWRRTGCGPTSVQTADVVVLQAPNAPYGPLEAIVANTGDSMGTITTSLVGGGGPQQVSVAGGSPLTYEASVTGTLLVYGTATVALSRGNSPFYPMSDAGGALPMLANDTATVTWSGTAPQVTFFPGG